MIPSKEEYEKLSKEEQRQSSLEYWEHLRDERDAYTKLQSNFINKVLEKNDCRSYKGIDIIGELCYVLEHKDEMDIDDCYEWSRTYFSTKLNYLLFHPDFKMDEKMETLATLTKLLKSQELVEQLGIDYVMGVGIAVDLFSEIQDIQFYAEEHKRPKKWKKDWVINRLADNLFLSLRTHKIPHKTSISLVLDIYMTYDFFSTYDRLDTQRTRAINKFKEKTKLT